MHHVTELLESNNYVLCLMIDFSKAFDVVDHAVIVENYLNYDYLGLLLIG